MSPKHKFILVQVLRDFDNLFPFYANPLVNLTRHSIFLYFDKDFICNFNVIYLYNFVTYRIYNFVAIYQCFFTSNSKDAIITF